jgi:homogentisate 1,2-dioxygenase
VPHYRQLGEVPRKRHTQFRRPDGGLYAEELTGAEGFSSDSSLLYHRQHAPTAIVAAEAVDPNPTRHPEPPAAASPPARRTT